MKGLWDPCFAAGKAASILLLSLLFALSHAGSGASMVWMGAYWEDDPEAETHTFITVTNLGDDQQTVTVTFFSETGGQVASESFLLPAQNQLQLTTESAGGTAVIEGTAGANGYMSISADEPELLQPWSAVRFEDELPRFTLDWVLWEGNTVSGNDL